MHINFLWALRSPALNILVNFSEPNICLTLFHHGTISFVPSINIPRRVRSLRTQYLNCYSRVKNYSLHRPFFLWKEKEMIGLINSFNGCLLRQACLEDLFCSYFLTHVRHNRAPVIFIAQRAPVLTGNSVTLFFYVEEYLLAFTYSY